MGTHAMVLSYNDVNLKRHFSYLYRPMHVDILASIEAEADERIVVLSVCYSNHHKNRQNAILGI